LPCGFFFFVLLSFFFSSPNLSRRRLDVCRTSAHGVALVRIWDAGLKRAARGSLIIQDANCHRQTDRTDRQRSDSIGRTVFFTNDRLKMAEPIDMPFSKKSRVGPRNRVLDGVQIRRREGAIFGGCPAIQKHWKSSLQPSLPRSLQKGSFNRQLPITSCCRRDHSVCQASANRNPENYEHRRCGLSAGKRVMGVHSADEV